MMKSIKLITLILVATTLHSCFKKDDAVPVHPRGPVRTDTINMTDTYIYQVYFDLTSGTAVRSNIRTETDLGFESSPDGWKVILNTADFMKVVDLGTVPFGQPYDTTGMKQKFDKSDDNPDSLAFGQWFTVTNGDTVSLNHVYAVSRGIDPVGKPLGLTQVIFDSLRHGTYYFRFAKINGQDPHSASVTKDPAVNYNWFSLTSPGSVVSAEPPKDSYDLLFTQYTTLLFTDLGEAYPYLVTGVLLNRNGVMAIKDSIHSFSTVTLDDVKDKTFSSALDEIGYDWKKFDFDAQTYTVRTDIFYVIKDRMGYYYKLRFISFYNSGGKKGYPVIEYQML
jgi:hypothetical protein